VQRTVIFVAKIGEIKVEGAAHRNINSILRCAAPSKRGYITIATNIAVRCTFYEKTLNFQAGNTLFIEKNVPF
jgi:hypothetical protein